MPAEVRSTAATAEDQEKPPRRYADLVLAAGVVAIVVTMIVRIPPGLMDVLIATNIGVSVAVLLAALYVPSPTRFASFPTILLLTTLFRLALNVSSTRLILLEAHAGQIIDAFGQIVVQGNFVVGGVVFLVLVLVQFIVITKGAERVAGVSARFVLDMMPGKQASIDADMRNGLIDAEAARRRRHDVEQEAKLYGAMEGAMKFVKGDAIAGICIALVNIVGGLIIGVTQMGMTATEAAQVFSLLTIGDGLVSQIPSLLIGVAAGLVVTRVAHQRDVEAGTSNLAGDIVDQAFGQPRALIVTAVLLVGLAVTGGYTGLPALPFLLLAVALLAMLGWRTYFVEEKPDDDEAAASAKAKSTRRFGEPSPIQVRVGSQLVTALSLDTLEGGERLGNALNDVRESLSEALGLPIPPIELAPRAWVIAEGADVSIHGAPVGRFALPTPSVDAFAAAVRAQLRRNAAELLGLQEASTLLEQMKSTHPELARAVGVPLLTTQQVADVLRALLSEQVSIGNLRPILETLARFAGRFPEPFRLAELCRREMRRSLCDVVAGGGRSIAVLHIDPAIVATVREALRDEGGYVTFELSVEERVAIVRAFVEAEAIARSSVGADDVLATFIQGELRRGLRSLLAADLPDVAVMAWDEIAGGYETRAVALVHLTVEEAVGV